MKFSRSPTCRPNRRATPHLVDYIEGDAGARDGAPDVPGLRQDSEERLRIHHELVESIRSGDPESVHAVVVAHRTAGR